MSVGAKHWALAQKVEGGSSPRIILFFLADWMIGDDQTECWPSLDTLVFETGMNRQTIIKATASLERQGLISKRVQWLRADGGALRKRVYYRLLGFLPEEWANSKRPESPKSRTSEISYVQESERTGSRTQESTKNRTHLSTKNRTQDGTKFRTGTGNTGIRQEDTGIDAHATLDDLVLSADTEKSKPKARRRKPSTPCPWEIGARIPEDLDEWAAAEYPTIDAGEEFQKFVGWALSKDMRYARWDQAFRNWMSNALKFQSQRGGYGGSGYRSKRQPTCPGDWEKEFKGVDYTRGVNVKTYTPEESAELDRICEEMGF